MSLELFSMLIPLSVAAGINLYLTVLLTGLSVQLGWVESVPAGLEPLGSWLVILVAGVFFAVEFLADKIQFVDNLWDLVHTVIRPLGATALALSIVLPLAPEMAAVLGLAAGSLALVSHGGKAGTRITLNIASPAENLSNTGLSLLEDGLVALLVFLALRYPMLALVVSIILLVLIIIFVPLLLRWLWFTVNALIGRLRGFVVQIEQPDILPPDHQALVAETFPGKTPTLVARCKAQNLHRANGRTGYLMLAGNQIVFTFDGWRKAQIRTIDAGKHTRTYLRKRMLMDVVEIHYTARPEKTRRVLFAFMKDRASLAAQLAYALGAEGVPPPRKPHQVHVTVSSS